MNILVSVLSRSLSRDLEAFLLKDMGLKIVNSPAGLVEFMGEAVSVGAAEETIAAAYPSADVVVYFEGGA